MTPTRQFHRCFSVGAAWGSVRLFCSSSRETCLAGSIKIWGKKKKTPMTHVQQHAPGTREFNLWIVRNACLRSVIEVHRKYCPICQGG